MENYYVVLSNHGKLYYGARQDPLKHVMDNVDAGKFIYHVNNFFHVYVYILGLQNTPLLIYAYGLSTLSMITSSSPRICSIGILRFQQHLAGHFFGTVILCYHFGTGSTLLLDLFVTGVTNKSFIVPV